MENEKYISFYDNRRSETYAHDYHTIKAKDHPYYISLIEFLKQYNLFDKKCLEIGSSGGFFQDLVIDYTGTDVAESLREFYHKPYYVTSGARYPFNDNAFDVIWTITVFEHIPDLQIAMNELFRILKPGGYLYFAPAWQCRSWAAEGYEVRKYSDFNLIGKLIKLSIPIRNSVLWRSIFIFPKRFFRTILFYLGLNSKELDYKKIKANYDKYWTTDADACNSIDPYDVILWSKANNFECLSHQNILQQFFVRNGVLVLRKK
jgi:SAM-dependent methyltransferase